ncbi:hypothetical protein EON63_21915 [archaeon]|nr:MAG: hypothetical protein EON63_21915 [archaeon]
MAASGKGRTGFGYEQNKRQSHKRNEAIQPQRYCTEKVCVWQYSGKMRDAYWCSVVCMYMCVRGWNGLCSHTPFTLT